MRFGIGAAANDTCAAMQDRTAKKPNYETKPMTLPIERARSLRWGWELLWELKTASNLTALQRATILIILDH